jgi:toxin HigB-1
MIEMYWLILVLIILFTNLVNFFNSVSVYYMRVSFNTEELVRLYVTPVEEIKGKLKYSKEIIKQYKKKVIILLTIEGINELKEFRGLNFERLKGEMKDYYSIRLNKQFRLLFKIVDEKEAKIVIEEILITEISKHYE